MSQDPQCPKCQSEYTYRDGDHWVCSLCAEEWSLVAKAPEATAPDLNVIKDAYGNVLADGDSVTVIKELRIKGSSSAVKVGTKVKNIRLKDSADGHNIACKIEGLGAINLKSEFVRKA